MRTQASRGCAVAARCLIGTLVLTLVGGCAAKPYRYGGVYHTDRDAPLKEGETQIERGRPAPVIDTVGWIIGVPAKILMLNCRADNHNISPETEGSIHEYLARNDLDKVKVRLNEYDPCGEWNRLKNNESIVWPVRYTIGTLSVIGYTVFPGRIWGRDQYNPFTNTVNIYSDDAGLALYEAGYAKDYAQRKYKGLYAVGYVVPGVGLWQEFQASGDSMKFIEENGSPDEVRGGYRSISPTFAYHALTPFASWTDFPVTLTALAAGHVSGQFKALSVQDINFEELMAEQETRDGALVQPTSATQVEPSSADASLLR